MMRRHVASMVLCLGVSLAGAEFLALPAPAWGQRLPDDGTTAKDLTDNFNKDARVRDSLVKGETSPQDEPSSAKVIDTAAKSTLR